jgi:hypothetical protein
VDGQQRVGDERPASAGVAWWIALRYLRTRRRQFAAFITRISVASLTLGVLVLTVVVSVMNGFDAELRQRILGTVPHLLIEGVDVDDPRSAELRNDPAWCECLQLLFGRRHDHGRRRGQSGQRLRDRPHRPGRHGHDHRACATARCRACSTTAAAC